MALPLASRSCRAAACMASGKRMGNESVCVLATLGLLLGHDLLGTGHERLLFVRAHPIEPPRERSDEGQQILCELLLKWALFPWVEHGQRHAKAGKQGLQVF